MNERASILARIREALSTPAHSPAGALPSAADRRRVLPAVPADFAGQRELFRANAAALRADFYEVQSAAELENQLRRLRDAEGWKMVASHNGTHCGPAVKSLDLPCLYTDSPYGARELSHCDAGFTDCDALIAQTGTVLLTNRSAGGRALSVLPPHHVVIARRDQLVPDLPAAFELLTRTCGNQFPSMISFVTGPSRTGDIERILVLGAHGPKKLTIFML